MTKPILLICYENILMFLSMPFTVLILEFFEMIFPWLQQNNFNIDKLK